MIDITLQQANLIWNGRDNGRIDGMSASKGGRVWIDGEFQLCELEALCVVLRDHAGERAEGAAELVAHGELSDLTLIPTETRSGKIIVECGKRGGLLALNELHFSSKAELRSKMWALLMLYSKVVILNYLPDAPAGSIG